MNAIELLEKIVTGVLKTYPEPSVQWINLQDFCLDDIVASEGSDRVTPFLHIARQLSQLRGRTIKSVSWHVIKDMDCAIDATIGFFRIELEPK